MDKGKKINWKNGLLLSAVSYLAEFNLQMQQNSD